MVTAGIARPSVVRNAGYSAFSCEVHWGQRTAARGICEQQYAHAFNAGAAGTGAGARSLFTWRTSRNIAKDTITKLMTAFKKMP